MADNDPLLPTDFDERFSDVYNRFTVPGQDTPLYTPKSSIIDFKKPTVKERFGGLPTEGPPEAFYTPPIERGKGGTLVEVPKKLREGNYELTPVESNIAPGSLREVLFGYDKPVGRFQSWPERLARIVGKGAFNIVEAIPGGVTAPYEAYKGRLQVTDPETGMPTEEAIQRSIAALSLPGGAGVIGGAEKGAIGAGPYSVSEAYKNRFLPNGVPKPEAFDRVLPAVRNKETGKISTTKRGNEHADILTRLWEREGGSPHADIMSIYDDMLPRHEMGFYDPKNKQFFSRSHPDWENIDSPDLNPRQFMRADQVFSDTSKQAQLLSSLTASQRKTYNREAFRNGGQMLVPEASQEAIRKLVEEPSYKKWEKAANDAGFTIDAYHGTSNFEGSTIEPKRAGKTEFYSTDEPKLAEDYSGKSGGVLPLKLNTSNYHTIDAHGKTWDQINEQVIKTAKEQGNSGVTIKNLRDSAADREVEPATVHITFDSSTVRSRFAKFNPEDVKKNGLLLSDTQKPALAVTALRSKFEKLTKEMDEAETRGVELPQSKYDEWNELRRQKWASDQGYNIEAYHGTNTPSNFSMFNTDYPSDLGSHFGTKEQANERAIIDNPKNFPPGSVSRVIPTRLNIQNPLRLEDKTHWTSDDIASSLREKGFDKEKIDKYTNLPKNEQNAYLKKIIEDKGYDGIVYLNRHEGKDVEAWRNKSGLNENELRPHKITDEEFKKIVPTAKDSYIAFHPHQIRSQFAEFNPRNVGKAGMFLSETSKPAAMLAPAFHSAVENAVNNAKIKTGTPEQWLGYLKNQQGVKQEELDWIRPQDVLTNEKGQVSKEVMQDYVNSHKVELKEVNKGEWTQENTDRLNKLSLKNMRNQLTPEEKIEYEKLIVEQDKIFGDSNIAQKTIFGPDAHSNLSLPGSENYREKLLILPQKSDEQFKAAWKAYTGVDISDATPQQIASMRRNSSIVNEVTGDYKSSHWDEPNVLAHVRMNDRNIPGVGKSLHLEEIQSDWHQAGRDKGYAPTEQDRLEASNKIKEIRKQQQSINLPGNPEDRAKWQSLENKAAELGIIASNRTGLVPHAPFKKTWSDLALKRMIREASEKNYDAISWTPGEAQAQRYDLSKQVSQIEYNPENGHLIVRDHNRNNVINKSVTKNELKNSIGKELSDKLLNSKLNKNDNHELSGLDLKIGGEGMKAFYDKMLVDKMNNLAKKYGGKVEKSNLPFNGKIDKNRTAPDQIAQDKYKKEWDDKVAEIQKLRPIVDDFSRSIPEDKWNTAKEEYNKLNRDLDAIHDKMVNETIERLQKSTKGELVHVLKLPQSMKDAALQKGFPLFSKTGHILTPTSNPYINNENDVPYGAGASDTSTGYPVHVDKRIPEMDPKLTLPSGEPANLHSYLQVHEITEHQLMKRGMSYEQAHKRATEREKAAVERDGVSWDEYSHIMSGYLKETEKEKVDNPPPNLYKRPYAHDRKELKKLEK